MKKKAVRIMIALGIFIGIIMLIAVDLTVDLPSEQNKLVQLPEGYNIRVNSYK